jgi:hypothetical protein
MTMAFMNEHEHGDSVDLNPLLTKMLTDPDPNMEPEVAQYLRWVAAKVASEAFWEDVKDHMRTTVDEEFQDQDYFGDDEVDDPPEEVLEVGCYYLLWAYDLAYEAIYQRLKGWCPWAEGDLARDLQVSTACMNKDRGRTFSQ